MRSRSHTTYSIGLTTAAIEITWARGRDPELYQVVVDQTYGTLEAIIYIRDDTQVSNIVLLRPFLGGRGAFLSLTTTIVTHTPPNAPRPPNPHIPQTCSSDR